jgi:putative zinc finger/helix-turn-helix YgiT family protein
MKCPTCREAALTEKKANHLYKESGLSNVVLVNVTVQDCPKCGEHMVLIPRLEELHRVIAKHIVEKSARLTGEEVRFLRKQLGVTAKNFAATIGVDPTTLSAWENGDAIGGSSDRLIRLTYVIAEDLHGYHVDQLAKISDDVEPVKMRLSATREWNDSIA